MKKMFNTTNSKNVTDVEYKDIDTATETDEENAPAVEITDEPKKKSKKWFVIGGIAAAAATFIGLGIKRKLSEESDDLDTDEEDDLEEEEDEDESETDEDE